MPNTAVDLKKYFSTEEKPCSAKEMTEFWQSLTDAEKDYYRNAEISN